MRNKLWITRWNQRRKNGAIAKQQEGTAFLSSYVMNDFKRVFFELCVGLQMKSRAMVLSALFVICVTHSRLSGRCASLWQQ